MTKLNGINHEYTWLDKHPKDHICVNRQRKWATSGTKVNGHLGLAPAPPKK